LTSSGPIKLEIVKPQELSRKQLTLWRRFQSDDSSLQSPYFSYQFTQAVSAVRSDARVGVFERGGDIVAFFPFHLRRFGVGKPIGGLLADYHGLIAREDFVFSPMDLIQECGLQVFDFSSIPTSQMSFSHHARKVCQSPRLVLSDGYNAYLESRLRAGTRQVSGILRKQRKLKRDHGELQFVCNDRSGTALDALLRWKNEQYRRTGFPAVLARSWTVQLLKRILSIQDNDFAGLLSTLYIDERLVAVHMGMRSQTAWHYWFPAYNRQYSKYSPGLILLLKMAKHAPSLGVTTIDLGCGESRYKRALASDNNEVYQGSITTPSVAGLIRNMRDLAENTWTKLPIGSIAAWPERTLKRVSMYLDLRY
jgi:CelD/BcsL family acetyltransferase involved in cellulose biosynthesis